jgi:hypothetical protein
MDKATVERALLELRLSTIELLVTKALLAVRHEAGQKGSLALEEHLIELEGLQAFLASAVFGAPNFQNLTAEERTHLSDEFRDFFEGMKTRAKQTFELPQQPPTT